MANNCYNYITISGNQDEISELKNMLVKTSEQSNSDLYHVLRNSFEIHTEDARWFEMDAQESGQDEIIISGDSAWCPSLGLFTEISNKFKSLQIRYEYEEGGCDFAGFAEINGGICADNCFGYWKGKILINESDAFEEFCLGNLEDYEDELELSECSSFNEFSKKSQAEILELFKTIKN
jgi:hypothetical protein